VASRSSRYVPRTTGLARNASLEIERRLRPGPRAGPTSGSTPVTYGPSTRRPRPWRTWVDAPRIPSKLVMQVRFTVHTPPRTSEARARAPRSAARRNSHGAAVRVKITRAERDQLAPAVNAVTSTRAGRSIAGANVTAWPTVPTSRSAEVSFSKPGMRHGSAQVSWCATCRRSTSPKGVAWSGTRLHLHEGLRALRTPE
jgi:hypothetical protein